MSGLLCEWVPTTGVRVSPICCILPVAPLSYLPPVSFVQICLPISLCLSLPLSISLYTRLYFIHEQMYWILCYTHLHHHGQAAWVQAEHDLEHRHAAPPPSCSGNSQYWCITATKELTLWIELRENPLGGSEVYPASLLGYVL